MIDSVIFDMDGIIIDSEPLWEKAEIQLINTHGKTYNSSYRKNIIGLNQMDSVLLLKDTFNLNGSIVEIIEERKNILLNIYQDELYIFPGIINLLEEVKRLGLKIGLASGSPQTVINFVIKRFKLDQYFTAVVSGDTTKKGKPAPDIYHKTAELLETDSKKCIAIEDSVNGVLSVKNAGMFCIAVPHPELDIQKYSGADIICKSIADINMKSIISELRN